MSEKIPLININDVVDDEIQTFKKNGFDILLVKTGGKIHVIENRCGHFQASLENAKLGKNDITCLHHFAKFSLEDGRVLNDVVEDCDNLKMFDWKLVEQIITVCVP